MPPEETIIAESSASSTSGSTVKPSSSVGASSSSSTTTTFPSLVDIKKQIPAKYFQASIPLSLYYVARSVVFVLATTIVALLVTLPSSPYYLQDIRVRALAWVIYWAVQGTLFWGIFTLGHDCGHASFSKYKVLNQIFGNILHSFLLVPYESWKLTHNHHHKNTGHIDNDEVFYPHRTNEVYDQIRRFVVVIMGPAWYIYLYGRRHFWPVEGDTIFKGREFDVAVSHTSWFLMLSLVVYATKTLGSSIVLYYYFAPLTMFASWLVVTTFLHHSDPDTPWYSGEEWNYVKGNLSSVDRSYGYGINNVIHNIGTHQIHHLFPIIPHYYLVEATEHFRAAFPHLVRISDESIMSAFFRNWSYYLRFGHSVSKDTTVFRYRDAEKLATKLAKIEKRR